MQRLRAIGADPRADRRIHVVYLFTDLLDSETPEFAEAFAAPVIEVCLRTMNANAVIPDTCRSKEQEAALESAQLLMLSLEKRITADCYVDVLGAVQTRLRKNKVWRKQQESVLAITDPKQFAQNKILKTQRKAYAKKRKAAKHLVHKGTVKRPSPSPAF
jgi:hypothetical protein